MSRTLRASFALTLLIAAASRPAAGQALDPKAEFLDALGRFSLALDGTYGDEGTQLTAALDAMSAALGRWDASIEVYERAMTRDVASADTPLAARMHLALGGVYLDRGRRADALKELAAALKADPGRPDVLALQGLAHARLTGDDAAALDAYRAAAAREPESLVRTYQLARQLLRMGREEEGVDLLQRSLVRLKPDTAPDRGSTPDRPFLTLDLVEERPGIEPFLSPALYADAFAALHRGDLVQMMALLKEAVPRDALLAPAPAADRTALERASALFRDGQAGEARAHLEALIARSPDHAEAHRVLGMVNIADGQHDRAVASLEAAIRLNPKDERARLALGSALVDNRQLDEAGLVLRETLEAFPASARTHYLLGLSLQPQGRTVEAIRALEAALAARPLLGANTIHRMIGVLHRDQQDLDRAAAAYSARVDLVPNDAAAHRELGNVYYLQGDNVKAQAEFEIAVLLSPSDVAALTALGQVHLREGRAAAAAGASRRALELDASDREARYVHATALIRLGDTDGGTREMQEFQRLQAQDSERQARAFALGRLRREAAVASDGGDHARAVSLLREALVLDPTAAASHLDLGLALLRSRQFPEAIERLATAAALNAHFDVHRHLAEAYAGLGQSGDSQRAQARYEELKRDAIRRTGRSR